MGTEDRLARRGEKRMDLPVLGFSYNDELPALWGETPSLFIASSNCFFLIRFVWVCVALALGRPRCAKPVTSLRPNQ